MSSPPPPSDGLARAIQRAAGIPRSPGNTVDLLIDGEATYAAMHERIASARRTIHLENYIIRADSVGQAFAAALIARARAGLDVRVLYDWLGSLGTPRAFWRALREAGVAVRPFGPPRFIDPILMAARDHRKLLVTDGERAVTGGLCIGDEWIPDTAACRLGWRDTAVAVDGPAARAMDHAFARAWRFAGGEQIDEPRVLPDPLPEMAGIGVQVVATEPGRERASRVIDLMVGASEKRLWVTDAYLAMPQRLYQAFRDAARDGVDVRLLLPGTTDLGVVQQLTRAGYRNLLRSGVRIWEWNGPMLHAKTIVADGCQVRIGSSNLNPSSLLANWELEVFIEDDAALARQMEAQFEADLARSSEVVLRPWQRPLLANRGLPPILLRQEHPVQQATTRHVPTSRERRRRAYIMAAGLIRGARAAIFGPIALILLLLAALFVLFPQPMAWGSAALSGGVGLALLVRARGHRIRA